MSHHVSANSYPRLTRPLPNLQFTMNKQISNSSVYNELHFNLNNPSRMYLPIHDVIVISIFHFSVILETRSVAPVVRILGCPRSNLEIKYP